jgi:hypothetical protein
MNARPPRHWIKRPPRPSRRVASPTPTPSPPRRVLVTVIAGVVTAFVAAYVAANTYPEPSLTWAALGFGGALGAAFAWRLMR